jgi:hypothetical protein
MWTMLTTEQSVQPGKISSSLVQLAKTQLGTKQFAKVVACAFILQPPACHQVCLQDAARQTTVTTALMSGRTVYHSWPKWITSWNCISRRVLTYYVL